MEYNFSEDGYIYACEIEHIGNQNEYNYEIYTHNNEQKVKITAYYGSDENVTLPEMIDGLKVSCIGKGAFKNNRYMRSVGLPPFVEAIDEDAFRGSSHLQNVKIPGSVKFIGDHAFADLPELKRIRIPSSVTKFGRNVFKRCPLLQIDADPYTEAKTYAKDHGLKFVENPERYPPAWEEEEEAEDLPAEDGAMLIA